MQTQRGVTPFIIETINATPSPISHLSVRPSHPPPRRSRVWGMHRRMCMPAGMCALTDAYLQNIFVLFSTSFILLDSWQRCTSADKSDTGQKMLDGKRAARRSPCFGMAADLSCRGRKEIPAAVWWHEFNSGSPALPLITADNLPRRDVGNVVICSAVVWPAKCC